MAGVHFRPGCSPPAPAADCTPTASGCLFPGMAQRSSQDRPRGRLRLDGTLTVALVVLLALGLRLCQWRFQPLWGDEGWSFYFAGMPLPDMLALTAQDIHPPLYYGLLHVWLGLTGSTPEAARLLSIFIGTLMVPVTYRLGRLLSDRRAGLFSAALVALAPLAVYYSQEVRMYGLVTVLGLMSFYFFARLLLGSRSKPYLTLNPSPQSPLHDATPCTAIAYAVVTAAALYTMYYAAFLVLAQALVLALWLLARRAGRQGLRRIGLGMLAAGALYLPWAVYAGTRLAAYVQGKHVAEAYLPLGPAHYLALHLSAFSLGHLSEALQPLAWATLLSGALAILGVLVRPMPRAKILLLSYLLTPLFAGFLVNLVYPFTPRFFERTLLLAAPAWWLLVGAGLAWLSRRGRIVTAAIGVLLVGSNVAALADFYNTPRYHEEDYRPLLTTVRTHSSGDDVILASYQWQLGLYQAYLPTPHLSFYVVPGWGEGWADHPDGMRGDLEALLTDHPRLWFPAYQSLGRLWETQVETILNRIAYPAGVDWDLPGTKLTLYGRGTQMVPVQPTFAQTGEHGASNFAGRLSLDQVRVGAEPVEAGRGVVPVALEWRMLRDADREYRIALQVVDESGRRWAGRDSLPQGGQGSFTELPVGERMSDHHGVLIPAGTPPGDYQLRLSVIDGQDERPLDLLDAQGQPQGSEVVLGTVRVATPPTPLAPEALPVQHPMRADFEGGVRLLGYSLGETPVKAGDVVSLSLFWQAMSDQHVPLIVFAQLQDETGRPMALSEAPPVYPADRWSAGMLLRDPHRIPLPAALPAGVYRLAVGLLRADGSRLAVGAGDQVVLTQLATTQREHVFTSPTPAAPWVAADARFGDNARLVAVEIHAAQSVSPGATIDVVLHWQALEPFARRHAVFVHLVDAHDRIYGQRDQEPGGGRFPTTGWVTDEFLVDACEVPVNADAPPGSYFLEVGLYDPLDGSRLAVSDAQGVTSGNRLLLRDAPIQVQ